MRRKRLNGLTRFGLVLVGAAWCVLLLGGRVADLLSGALPQVAPYWPPGLDRGTLANALLLTGFGLAILGALHHGFGALNRFFDAVLGNMAGPPAQPDRATAEFEAALAQPHPQPQAQTRPQPTLVRSPEALRKPPRPPVRPPGVANYIVREDGTTEVETLLGVRRFTSEKEAREFLGA